MFVFHLENYIRKHGNVPMPPPSWLFLALAVAHQLAQMAREGKHSRTLNTCKSESGVRVRGRSQGRIQEHGGKYQGVRR